MAASFLGGLPWWLTFNALSAALPVDEASPIAAQLAQRAVVGFLSTAVSDCLTNGLRVLKTSRQTSPTSLSYCRHHLPPALILTHSLTERALT